MDSKPEAVNHPPHYGGADNVYEHVKVCDAWRLDYWLGNATKYICRAGKKGSDTLLQDLKKAHWYLTDTIRRHHDPEFMQVRFEVRAGDLPTWEALNSLTSQLIASREGTAMAVATVDKLAYFKAFVHDELTRCYVPADPYPEETARHGCRISGRLRWLLEHAIANRPLESTLWQLAEEKRQRDEALLETDTIDRDGEPTAVELHTQPDRITVMLVGGPRNAEFQEVAASSVAFEQPGDQLMHRWVRGRDPMPAAYFYYDDKSRAVPDTALAYAGPQTKPRVPTPCEQLVDQLQHAVRDAQRSGKHVPSMWKDCEDLAVEVLLSVRASRTTG